MPLVELHAVLQLLLLHGQQLAVRRDPIVALVADLPIDATSTHDRLLGGHADLLLELRVVICAAEVQVRVAGQLRDGLCFALASLVGHDHARKVLVRVAS